MSKTAPLKKLPSEFLPSFPAYYDTARKFYWIENDRNAWIEITETGLRRHLRAAGISPNCPDGQIVSPMDSRLIELQTKFHVAYAGPLAGYPKGIHEISGNRILVNSSPKLISPKSGKWPWISARLKNLFADPLLNQRPYVIGWLKVGVAALRSRQHRPGQALAVAGPHDSGKSLFQHLVTEMCGGRSAKPYRYMRDQTEFNGELFGAEHLMIEDEVASTDIRTHRNFGARIKEITVNQTQSFHARHRQAITLTPLWRLTISLPDAHALIASLHQQLQQALWRVGQLEKELFGPSSERRTEERLSKEQIYPAPDPPSETGVSLWTRHGEHRTVAAQCH